MTLTVLERGASVDWRGTCATILLLLASGVRADEPSPDLNVEPVSDAVCVACHNLLEEGFESHYARTIHAKVLTPQNALDNQMGRGCESCHGPGRAHVQAGGGKGVGDLLSFAGTSPEDVAAQDAVCLQCHQQGKRRFWIGSVHSTRDVGCTSCHTVMRSVSERNQLSKKTQVATCGQCHQIQNARQYRNAHMPLRPGAFQSSTADDGKMSCGSCHNP